MLTSQDWKELKKAEPEKYAMLSTEFRLAVFDRHLN